MAEETQSKAEEVAVEEKATVTEPAPAKEEGPKKLGDELKKPEEESEKLEEEAIAAAAEAEEKKDGVEECAAGEEPDVSAAMPQSVSFKEESNVVADLQDPEKKALDDLRQLVQAALANNEFNPPPPPPPPPAKEEAKTEQPTAEEPKAEQPATEEPKAEQPTTEEPVAAAAAEEPPKVVEEAKTEEPTATEVAEEPLKAGEPAAIPAAEEEKEETTTTQVAEEPPKAETEASGPPPAEEKAVVVEEEAAKTVEAIKETVVPVATPEVTPAAEAPAEKEAPAEAEAPAAPAEEFIWGVPLLGDEKSDTILLKFLRARDFKVKDAMAMLKNTVVWRKTFGIEPLLEEDLGFPEMNKVAFMHGLDKEGHPVCYNVYGEFQDKELYSKAFGDEEKRQKFLRWRIQFLEKGIRQQLDFSPGGVCTMVQVNDLKNSPGPGKRELRQTTNQALALLQDNYPEFVAKQVFINVPWWYLAYNRMISPFLTQRTKSKFVFAGPSKSAETLFKYIAPEQVPVQYGGLSKENDLDFTTADAVTEITIKPSSKQTIEIPVTEPCLLVWELRVLGWDVTYGAEFAPSAEGGYSVIVQKVRKLIPTDDPVVKNSFKIGEPGKIILTIDNTTSKKKKLLYRSKASSSTESV